MGILNLLSDFCGSGRSANIYKWKSYVKDLKDIIVFLNKIPDFKYCVSLSFLSNGWLMLCLSGDGI